MQDRQDKIEENLKYEELIWATLSNKWKISILMRLSDKVTRFNQLRRELVGISDKILAGNLKDLEANGLVSRTEYEELVLRVEYSLTEKGEALIPIINRLVQWWNNY